MNLHNLPNVIGEQRKLLKAISDAEITSDDMLKLSELDPEFGKLASIVATIYSKLSTTTDVSLAEVMPKEEQTVEPTTTQREEWVPVTKLRNMYPMAYSFLRNRVDLSANGKEEIWKVFRKVHSEYTISEDDFYRLMRLVINIRVEKAREIDEKVNSSLTAPQPAEPQSVEKKISTSIGDFKMSPQKILDQAKKCRPGNSEEEKIEPEQTEEVPASIEENTVQKKRGRGGAVVLKDLATVMKEYPKHYYWLKNQQLDYLKKNTASKILEDFIKRNPNSTKIGRTYFNMLIKQVLSTKTEQVQEPIGQYKLYPGNEHIRLFEDGSIQVWTKKYGWRVKKPTKSNGYAKFSFEKKSWAVAKIMLETYKPMKFADGKTHVPYYKDGNKMNCSIDNLSWDMPDTVTNERNIHEACEIIRDNPHAGEQELLAIMGTRGVGVQRSCLRSILAGNYTSISEKYFTLQNGKPILKSETSDEVTVSPKPGVNDGLIKRDMTSVDKLVNTINYKKLMEDRRGDVLSYFKATKNLKMAVKAFEAKMELKMTIDSSDKIIPVLEFSLDKDGNIRNAGDILRDITKKYGNLYITQNYVKDILNGKIGKEYSDLVFNK